jgi:DNA-binding PadR family transcriptional regulator
MTSKKVNFVGLGSLQKRVLLWIGVRSDIGPVKEQEALVLVDRWKKVKGDAAGDDVVILDTSMADLKARVEKTKRDWEGHEAEFFSLLEERGLEHPDAFLATQKEKSELPGRVLVRWSPSEFFKGPVGRSDSANVSKALRSLEKRKLIRRHEAGRSRGQIRKTTHVGLTPDGADFCFAYWLKKWAEYTTLGNDALDKELQAKALENKATRLYIEALEEGFELLR